MNHEDLIAEMRKSLRALYLEVPESIARDVERRSFAAVDQISSENAALRRVVETPQVKRLAESHAPICTCELCHAWRDLRRTEEDGEHT